MAKRANDLLQGTLDLIVLRALQSETRHGWGIQQRINQIAEDALSVNQGSLYPALLRLEKRGYIKSSWGRTENGRRAKYYELTKKGSEQMETELALWRQFSGAINLILKEV